MNKLLAGSTVSFTSSKRGSVCFMVAAAVMLLLIGCVIFFAIRHDKRSSDYATRQPLGPKVTITVTNASPHHVISMICQQTGMGLL